MESIVGDTKLMWRSFTTISDYLLSVQARNLTTQQKFNVASSLFVLLVVALIGFLLRRSLFGQVRQSQHALVSVQKDLNWQFEHDHITELASSAGADAILEDLLARVSTDGRRFAVYLVRLNDLMALHESYGNTHVESLLQTLADRLRILFPDALCLARVTEQDLLIIPDEHGSNDGAHQTANKTIHVLQRPVSIGDTAINAQAIVGVTLLPDDGDSARAIRDNCEIALRHATVASDESTQLYHESMRHPLDRSKVMVEEIKRGLQQGEFSAFFQPKFRLADGTYCGCEALIRWHHPRDGLLLPAAFLPAADKAGLMGDITRTMLGNIERHCLAWSEQGLEPCAVAVNIPGKCLFSKEAGECIQMLGENLQRLNIRLHLEVDEDTAVLQHLTHNDVVTHLFSDPNVTFELNDFGAGLTSLTHLNSMPFEIVQLDRQFVAGLQTSEHGDRTLSSVLSLIDGLGKIAAAKGIETRSQQRRLQELGCQIGQGSLYSNALPPDGMRQFLIEQLRIDSTMPARLTG